MEIEKLKNKYSKYIMQLESDKRELLKDKKRLDFLLNTAYAIQLDYPNQISSSREDIDKAMVQKSVENL
tara:strand:+ start:68 stop:274 length:207 start_codon:yes stop_codon:yes gene_type:complete